MEESKFDGGLGGLIGWNILATLLTIFTLFLGLPWATCMKKRWECSHTIINGRRLTFDGTGAQLFGNWIKWVLLSIITLFIYSFWLRINLLKWQTKHTVFA